MLFVGAIASSDFLSRKVLLNSSYFFVLCFSVQKNHALTHLLIFMKNFRLELHELEWCAYLTNVFACFILFKVCLVLFQAMGLYKNTVITCFLLSKTFTVVDESHANYRVY